MADLMPASSTTRRRAPESRKQFPTARAAIAALEARLGRRSASWVYTDLDGKPVGVVSRWNLANGKEIRPVSLRDCGWTIGGMPPPRPLYRLSELAGAEQVFVCEGEKAVDAAVALGLVATTSAHGSGSAPQTDWSPLAGRDVVILPDNDAAGAKYTDEVTACLQRITPAPSIQIVELPGLPPSGDLVEFVADRGGAENGGAIVSELKVLCATVPQLDCAGPVHVVRDTALQFQPFPVDVLPAPLDRFVQKAALALACDDSYIALPLLVGLASAIGNARRIQLKRSWTEPAIMWGALIGESGSTKSPALDLALRPVRERQAMKIAEYEDSLKAWETEVEAAKRRKDDNLPSQDDAPICERHWTDDVTIEALIKLLRENPRGLLGIRDELAGWLHFDRYATRGSGGEAAKWLEVFGGRSLIVDRKTSGTIFAPRAAVSIIGCIQPDILRRALGPQHRESGLAARLLLTMPPRHAKVWTDDEIHPDDERPVSVVFQRLFALEPATDDQGNIQPIAVPLDRRARDAWVSFYNGHAQEHAALSGELAAAWSKLEGYAARFALVIHLVRSAANDPSLKTPDRVDVASIEAGVTLTRWFGREARRVYAMLNEDDEQHERSEFVDRIRRAGGSVTVREWQRSRSHKRAQDAESELHAMVSVGLGQWVTTQPGPKGGRTSRRFVLRGSPLQAVSDTTSDTTARDPAHDPKNEVVSVVSVSERGVDSDFDEQERDILAAAETSPRELPLVHAAKAAFKVAGGVRVISAKQLSDTDKEHDPDQV